MSEQTQNNNQQMIVIALVVIAVLLAAIVGVVLWQTTQKVPAPTAAAGATVAPDATVSGMGGASGSGTGAGAAAAPTAFDAKTATKVPAGMTPEQVVRTYLDDVVAGKFAEAYKFLPVGNSYGSEAAFESQVKPYGITKGNMGKPVTSGDTVTIAAEQVTPQMPITYTWTFKKVGDQWYVAGRTMGGSVQ